MLLDGVRVGMVASGVTVAAGGWVASGWRRWMIESGVAGGGASN